jgi:hypothetical protein
MTSLPTRFEVHIVPVHEAPAGVEAPGYAPLPGPDDPWCFARDPRPPRSVITTTGIPGR